jgi:hypothetical protein
VLSKQEVVSLAYFDGATLEEIAHKGFLADELRMIASQCSQWAYSSAKPSVRTQYLQRANSLVAMADGVAKAEDLFAPGIANIVQGWPRR